MTVRFGMVGTGFWAEDVHLPVLRDAADVELVGVWGRDAAKAHAVGARFGGRGFARFEDLLATVDALSFAVPPAIQPDLAIAAARAGKHMLLEKPLALRPEVARVVADAVEAAGVASVVFLTRRFIPEITTALPPLIAEGPWTAARARMHTGSMLPGTPYAGSVWRQEKGALWDLGPHVVSVLLAVLGPVVEADAKKDGAVTTLTLRHASGARSSATVSFHSPPADCAEFYEFSNGERTRRIDILPGARQSCFASALDCLLRAIAHPAAPPDARGVRLGADIVAVLAEAEGKLGA